MQQSARFQKNYSVLLYLGTLFAVSKDPGSNEREGCIHGEYRDGWAKLYMDVSFDDRTRRATAGESG